MYPEIALTGACLVMLSAGWEVNGEVRYFACLFRKAVFYNGIVLGGNGW